MKATLLSLLAIATLASCTDKPNCKMCITTETTSHGVKPPTATTQEVCGAENIYEYKKANNRTIRQAEWIGPKQSDSSIITITYRTECNGRTYRN